MAKRILVMEAFGHGVQPSGSEAKAVCDQYVNSHPGLDLTQARVRVNVNQMGDDQYAWQHYGLLHHPGMTVEWFNYTVAAKKYLLMVVSETRFPTAGNMKGLPDVGGIRKVEIFVSDRGMASIARSYGSSISRIAPSDLIPTADTKLGLCGALNTYMASRDLDAQNVPEMSNDEWRLFLDRRFPGKQWNRFFATTPSATYSVVVVRD